ncbi:MAG: hypothetical protein ACO3EZ_16465 [Prochlorotrichaceae cyanobacterium]
MADLTGTWLGTYWQNQEPTRFEATLIQSGNTLSGNILDDGHLGEATLQGTVVGRNVHFIKTYVSLTQQIPIDYTGVISEEEDFVQGRWSFPRQGDSGAWEARRSGDNLVVSFNRQLAATK